MSEQNEAQALAAEELEALKEKAKLLGIQHHPSIGAEALAKKIKEHQEAAANAAQASAPTGAVLTGTVTAVNSPVATANTNAGDGQTDGTPSAETQAQLISRIKADAEKLIRIRLTCMNPAKKEWQGEIFTVSNRAVGTLKKFVPFNADEGWHVPKMIVDVIKARECQVFVTTKSKNGVSVRKGRLIREFAVEVLDQLTPEELADLARVQAMAAGAES